jgi:hypothetical protein
LALILVGLLQLNLVLGRLQESSVAHLHLNLVLGRLLANGLAPLRASCLTRLPARALAPLLGILVGLLQLNLMLGRLQES